MLLLLLLLLLLSSTFFVFLLDIVGNFSTLKATSPLFIYRAVKESLQAIRKAYDRTCTGVSVISQTFISFTLFASSVRRPSGQSNPEA